MNIDTKSIYIVIPVHGRIQLTKECLLSLRRQSVHGFKTIVVDDGSPDETSEVLKRDFPEVELLRGDGNLWWSGAINLGVELAIRRGAEYVISVNNDSILAKDFIEGMKNWAKLKPTAIFGALMRDYGTREIVYGGERIRWLTAGNEYIADHLEDQDLVGVHAVTHCPGRGLWIPTDVFQTIGYFEAKLFPQSIADSDFTMRARRAGTELLCNYDATIYPRGDLAPGGKRNEPHRGLARMAYRVFSIRSGAHAKGRWHLARRNAPVIQAVPYLVCSIVRAIGGVVWDWMRSNQATSD